jgi:hypothetical protein
LASPNETKHGALDVDLQAVFLHTEAVFSVEGNTRSSKEGVEIKLVILIRW